MQTEVILCQHLKQLCETDLFYHTPCFSSFLYWTPTIILYAFLTSSFRFWLNGWRYRVNAQTISEVCLYFWFQRSQWATHLASHFPSLPACPFSHFSSPLQGLYQTNSAFSHGHVPIAVEGRALLTQPPPRPSSSWLASSFQDKWFLVWLSPQCAATTYWHTFSLEVD